MKLYSYDAVNLKNTNRSVPLTEESNCGCSKNQAREQVKDWEWCPCRDKPGARRYVQGAMAADNGTAVFLPAVSPPDA